MARIAGVNIPTNKRVLISLRYIYGIGPAKAQEICSRLTIPDDRRVNQLSACRFAASAPTPTPAPARARPWRSPARRKSRSSHPPLPARSMVFGNARSGDDHFDDCTPAADAARH